MKKTLLIGSLIAVLLVGLFVLTGCGDSQPASNQGGSQDNNASVQATEFYIQNAFPNDTTLKEVYANATGFDSWTPNLIAGLELAPGTRSKIGLGLTSATSSWDFKLVDSEGTAVTISAVDLSNILLKNAETVEFTVDSNGQIAGIVK